MLHILSTVCFHFDVSGLIIKQVFVQFKMLLNICEQRGQQQQPIKTLAPYHVMSAANQEGERDGTF